MKTALVSGITGQDGSYLAEYLLELGYKVVGLHRRSSNNNTSRISSFLRHTNFILNEFDLTDPSDCGSTLKEYQPDEFYNLAAQSHVGTSFKQPTTTFEINAVGVTNVLESIRLHSPHTRFYQASTSEMFGRNYLVDAEGEKYQNEQTPMLPQSPYACSKLCSHHMVHIYRHSYDLFGCSGILFNHESPRRGSNFVTRKITIYLSKLINGLINKDEKLRLGNINAYRDWGHAEDYVKSMHMILNHDKPDDYVIATGKTHSVKDFLKEAFQLFDMDYNDYIMIDPAFYRPCEVEFLKGDSTKAKETLGWQPQYDFKKLVANMVYSDLEAFKNEKKL